MITPAKAGCKEEPTESRLKRQERIRTPWRWGAGVLARTEEVRPVMAELHCIRTQTK